MSVEPKNELTIVRVLSAPRDKVWRACSQKEAMMQWWGRPKDATMPFCKGDFRARGSMNLQSTASTITFVLKDLSGKQN